MTQWLRQKPDPSRFDSDRVDQSDVFLGLPPLSRILLLSVGVQTIGSDS